MMMQPVEETPIWIWCLMILMVVGFMVDGNPHKRKKQARQNKGVKK